MLVSGWKGGFWKSRITRGNVHTGGRFSTNRVHDLAKRSRSVSIGLSLSTLRATTGIDLRINCQLPVVSEVREIVT